MFNIESLKDYINTNNDKEFIDLAFKIYELTSFNSEEYPKYKEWFFNKQLQGLRTNERNILFLRNPENYNEIISMVCLKKDDMEKKICSLYVDDKYRGVGIGTNMIEESMNWLGTTSPFITFSESKLDMFRTIIKKYNWTLEEIAAGIYNDNRKELCFNGTLTGRSKDSFKQQLQKKFTRILKYYNLNR